MDRDRIVKKEWTSPELDALDMAITAGGDFQTNEDNQVRRGVEES